MHERVRKTQLPALSGVGSIWLTVFQSRFRYEQYVGPFRKIPISIRIIRGTISQNAQVFTESIPDKHHTSRSANAVSLQLSTAANLYASSSTQTRQAPSFFRTKTNRRFITPFLRQSSLATTSYNKIFNFTRLKRQNSSAIFKILSTIHLSLNLSLHLVLTLR